MGAGGQEQGAAGQALSPLEEAREASGLVRTQLGQAH